MQLTLKRAANSLIPSAADSAVVRVWNATTNFSGVQAVQLPAPGTTTSMDFAVPSGSGYSVGVLAFKSPQTSFRHALAGGRTDNVTVSPSASTPVSVDVKQWTYALSGPDTMVSGQSVTYSLAITSGPVEDFFSTLSVVHMFLDTTKSEVLNPNVTRSGNTVAVTFNAPTVSADTALFMGFGLYVDGTAWQFNGASFAADLPSRSLGEALLRRPIKLPGGTITVTFDKRQSP